MIASFIIAFRETLEAALIIGIVLGFLKKVNQKQFFKIVYIGLGTGILTSIIAAFLFTAILNGFDGVESILFEGITMYVGAALLTTMILWMMRQSNVAGELREKMTREMEKSSAVGMFMVVFVAILREGIETVLFLSAASFVSEENNMWGGIIGIGVAIFLGYLIYAGSIKLDLKKFFTISSLLLVLFAAGLVAYGTHEIVEAAENNGIVNSLIATVWNINPPLNLDSTYPLFHDKGAIGSLLKGLFGYNGDPALIEVVLYGMYLALSLSLWYITSKRARSRNVSHGKSENVVTTVKMD